jgi:hypothetical protein
VARHGAPDLSESHFKGGKRLSRGFVEFAAHPALLFTANGQQLVRKPAQIGLGAGKQGNVASHAYDARDFSGGARNGRAHPVQNPNGTVGKSVGFGESERTSGANRGFEVFAELLRIFELEHWPEFIQVGRRLGLIQTVEPGLVLRPDDSARRQIVFPGSHIGNFFGVLEQDFGVVQALLKEALVGNVLDSQDAGAWRGRGLVWRGNGDVEPVRFMMERNGQLERPGDSASPYAANDHTQDGPRFASDEGEKVLTNKRAASLKRQRAIGTPDAKNLTAPIEFTGEFVELADDGSEATLIFSRD